MTSSQYPPIAHAWVRHDLAPIYEWAFPTKPTDEELRSFVAARNHWAKGVNFPVGWLVDLSNMTKASPVQRKTFADHVKEFEAFDKKYTVGVAAIVPNPLMRGLVTAVYWLTPPKFPNRVFSNRSEGLRWLEEQFANAEDNRS